MSGNAGAFQEDVAVLHEQVSRAFVEWRNDVYHYMLTFGLTAAEAQDATQEVFLRLYTALRKKEEPIRNQRAWVFRVAHNLGLTLRSRDTPLAPLEPDLESATPDVRQSAESALIEREKLLRIHRAVSELSPQQRQCLHLRAEGLRYQEIAQAMNISISTVSEFLQRAIVRLRKAVYE